jgi:hypothetical protein
MSRSIDAARASRSTPFLPWITFVCTPTVPVPAGTTWPKIKLGVMP